MEQKKRKIGKSKVEEEKLVFGLNQKQRGRVYTILFFVVVVILFILNNSTDDTKQGPYPPYYNVDQGEILNLTDLKGKVVLVDFWATWSLPCNENIPVLMEVKNEFKDKGLEIVGISVDALTRGGATSDDVIPFMKSSKINYPIVRGDELVIRNFGGIQSLPTSFLIDKEGRVVAKLEHPVSKKDYIYHLNKILNGNYESTLEVPSPNFSLALLESK